MEQQASGFEWIFLIGFAVIFYFMAIRPQQKKAKEHAQLISSLQKGDEVLTVSGIVGKVVKLTDEFIALEVSEKVELKFSRASISAILPKGTIKAIA
jgi:preprotein translocase subunit YajC